MYTEDEAKTKWCPHARDIVTRGVDGWTEGGSETYVGNRADNEPLSTCIASDCMAWRAEMVQRTQYYDEQGNLAAPGQIYKSGELEERPVLVGIGFCGLAGKP